MDPSPSVRVAVVGAGGMANQVHYPSLASFDDVEIVGICDLNEIRMTETADLYKIENRYSDYRKMVEAQAPDGIYVIGQPHYMYDIWVWCLEHGLNLYIEKPMGITWHQACILADLAEEKGVFTQVSHQRRSSPLLKKMREACLSRGEIAHAVCEFYKCDMKPYRNARDHMMDDCTHSIDTLRWMCGGEVLHIESQCKRIGTPDINWIGATLQFDNGATGYLINSWCSGRRVFRVEMHAATIFVDAEVEKQAVLYADGDTEGVIYDCYEVAGGNSKWEAFGFRDKNREFIDSLKTGIDVTTSPFRDCIKTMEVAEKILALALLNGE
ncbi:MAG: Gfo/Idh/MocA family oxidoreductase [bacterium]|nr:Gfo/Idh/MocA family oxidoreductase [bacterium]